MKKLSVFGLFLMLAMVLAACSGGGSSSNATATTAAGAAGGALTTSVAPTTEGTTGGVATSAATAAIGLGTSAAPTVETAGTQAGTTVPATGGLATSTMSAVGTTAPVVGATSAATSAVSTGVPATGAKQIGEFARLQDLMNFNVLDANNNSLGTIQDFVINIPKTRVDFIVLNYNGKTVLVPWSTLAFNRTAGNSFAFNGNMTALQNAPAFNANSIDWTSPTWDQDVINAWKTGGVSANGTAVATGVPATGGTPVATMGASSSMVVGTGTPQAGGGVPATGTRQVAILASQLTSVQVVENSSGAVPSTGGSSMSGTPAAGSTSSSSSSNAGNSAVAGTGTPSASSTGSAVAGSSNNGTTNSVPATGSLGTIQDGIVNMTSGDLPFFLLSADIITNTGSSSSTTGSSNSGSTSNATPMATSSAAMATSSSTTAAGTSVPATGSATGRFIPVPSNLVLFVGNNQAILQVPASMLRNAPVLDFSQSPVLNFGWDAQYFNYWQNGNSSAGGGTGTSTGTGTATTTP